MALTSIEQILKWSSRAILCITVVGLFLNKTQNWPCSLNPAQMKEFQNMLLQFDARCKKLRIPYYLSEGTLLGAVRDSRTIPWTDDVDLKLLYAYQIPLLRHFNDLFVLRGDNKPLEKANNSALFDPILNVTVFKLYSPKYFISKSNILYRLINKPIYIDITAYKSDWEPTTLEELSNITLDGSTFLKPKNSDEFLKRYYGVSYMLPQDEACDNFYCTNFTTAYCRKIIPFVWPLLLYLSFALSRLAT